MRTLAPWFLLLAACPGKRTPAPVDHENVAPTPTAVAAGLLVYVAAAPGGVAVHWVDLADRASHPVEPPVEAYYSPAHDGRAIFTHGDADGVGFALHRDGAGVMMTRISHEVSGVAPDGERVVAACTSMGSELCLASLDGVTPVELTPLESALDLALVVGWADTAIVAHGGEGSTSVDVIDPRSGKSRGVQEVSGQVLAVSADGRIAWLEPGGDGQLVVRKLAEPSAAPQVFPVGPSISASCVFAGAYLACAIAPSEEGTTERIQIASLDSGEVRLVTDQATLGHLVASPDGAWIAFGMLDNTGTRIAIAGVASGAPELVTEGNADIQLALGWLR